MSEPDLAALEKRIASLKDSNRLMRNALTSIVKRADDGGTLYEVRHIASEALDPGQAKALGRRRDSVERVLHGRPWQEKGPQR